MNKKEISEIKKQFTPDRCCITRICGCYVDGEASFRILHFWRNFMIRSSSSTIMGKTTTLY